MGRATQGVRLINIKGNDEIAAVTKVIREEEGIDVNDEETVDGDRIVGDLGEENNNDES
jgi:DNA gyrase subunit A